LIMLLVGFAFNNNVASKLSIGYYTPEKTNLTDSFVSALSGNPEFILVEYSSDSTCVDMIQQGKVHLCIIFPTDFRIDSNNSNELQFYVDQSRANFVYAVIDTVSEKISLTTNQVSYQLTNDLVGVIESTKKSNAEQLSRIAKIKTSMTDISSKLEDVQSDLENLDFPDTEIDLSGVDSASTNLKSSIKKLDDAADGLVELSEDAINELDSASDCGTNCSNILEDFEDDVNASETSIVASGNATDGNLSKLLDSLTEVSDQVDSVMQQLEDAKKATGDSSDTIGTNIQSLSSVKTNIDELKALIETSNARINGLKVTNAESIVNPIQTVIKPVSNKSGNISFIFPYFIILIIVFIGIMLSSNIIMMEKTSKAYFRNFTTPTKDLTFVMSVFLTSFVVVSLQLAFILGLAYYFLNTTIFTSLLLTVLLILAAISLFTLIGMVIGYAFNSQEAVTMASISVGSVLLFLSNLVLPLESMSPVVQGIAKYNPYVISSELLKKLTVFESSFGQVYFDFIILGIYIVVLFALVMAVEKASKVQFISKKPITKQLARGKNQQIERYFKLKNGVLLMNEKDLIEELSTMTEKEFEQYVNKKKNDFETWLTMNNKIELADKVGKATTRKEMMAALGASKDKVDPIAAAGINKIENLRDARDSKKKKD
ncbi:MAG TPA: ABC transporter permease, partial [Alphaproteobacteria bacterium]|nr:ABC transporter permease [Alphaproteobacteria bacterium]